MMTRILTAVVVGTVVLAGGATATAGNTPEVNRLLRKADQLKQDKDYQGAIKVLDQVLAADPGNADAWTEGAWIFNEMGKYDIAVQAADKALATDPDHSGAFREKGFALLKQKKYKDAAKALSTAIDKNEKNWHAYDYLAEALEKLGEYDLADKVRDVKKTLQASARERRGPPNATGGRGSPRRPVPFCSGPLTCCRPPRCRTPPAGGSGRRPRGPPRECTRRSSRSSPTAP
jgi:Tfp pilus assembly protein PilF